MLLLMINLPSRSNFTSTVAASDAVSWQHFHLSFPYAHQHLVGCGGSNVFVWMQKSGDTEACLTVKSAATSNMAGMSSAFLVCQDMDSRTPPPLHLIHSPFIFIRSIPLIL